MDQLRAFVLGLIVFVALVGLMLVASAAADFISARISSRLGAGSIAACVALLIVLPGLLTYGCVRSRHLILVALGLVPALVCVLAGMALVVRGPLGDLLRASAGRGGMVILAASVFGLSALGGLLGLLFGNPRADRNVQIAGALLLASSLAAWIVRLSAIMLALSLGFPVLLKWFATAPWPIEVARVINSPAFWTLLQALWVVALTVVGFVAAAELEGWMFARAASGIPERFAQALRAIEAKSQPILCSPLFLDGRLGAAPICEVRWRPFRRPILLVSRAALAALDDRALEGVLAHEAAHIKWGHLTSRLAWAFGLWLAVTAIFGLFDPRGLIATQIVWVSASVTYLFLLFFVVRAQEEQADRYAAEIVGAEPLLDALGCLSGSPVELYRGPDLSIWTTHGSWKVRRERLLGMRQGCPPRARAR